MKTLILSLYTADRHHILFVFGLTYWDLTVFHSLMFLSIHHSFVSPEVWELLLVLLRFGHAWLSLLRTYTPGLLHNILFHELLQIHVSAIKCFRLITLTVAYLTGLTLIHLVQTNNCPSGWVSFESSCYDFVDHQLFTWPAASERVCIFNLSYCECTYPFNERLRPVMSDASNLDSRMFCQTKHKLFACTFTEVCSAELI